MRYKVELEQTKTDGGTEQNYAVRDLGLDTVVIRFAEREHAQEICDKLNAANNLDFKGV